MIKVYPKNHDEQLSEHFWLSEFHCHCERALCTQTPVSEELVDGLEMIRVGLEVPVIVLSGHRCLAHNKEVGGEEKSYHPIWGAADIRAPGVSVMLLVEAAKMVPDFLEGGIGVYPNRIHVDVGPKRRWHVKA
jgi:zinc D-Ala-D-Ala carboxypeptidase